MAVLHSLQTIIVFILVLSFLVVAHEWGHFITARLFKIRVDDFSIGFGARLLRIGKWGDTEYNIRMLPLGGFVRIAGMEPDEAPLLQAKEKLTRKEQDDPDAAMLPLVAENSADPEPYTAPDGFNSKPRWQRSLVILAGPVMSFLLGYILFCLMGTTVGAAIGTPLNKIGMVEPGGTGQQIGLRAGDQILAINGQPVADGNQMVLLIRSHLGKRIAITFKRGSTVQTKYAVPKPLVGDNGKPEQLVFVVNPGAAGTAAGLLPGDIIDQIGSKTIYTAPEAVAAFRANAGKSTVILLERGLTPIALQKTIPNLAPANFPTFNAHEVGALEISPMSRIEHMSLAASIHLGNSMTWSILDNIYRLIRHGQLQKQVGGVVVMYRATNIAVADGASQVVFLAGQISLSLALFNLLPIPILDGGHLLNFFIEWVRGGRRMSEAWQARFMMTGLAIIGGLFVWVMYRNISQLIFHQLPQ